VLALEGRALAAGTDAPPPPAATARTVRVELVAEAALDPVFPRRIASWFDPGAFRVEVRAVPRLDAERVLSPEPDAGAVVWVTLKAAQGARLYFVRGTKERDAPSYLVRDIRLERGLDEIGAERVAEAIHFSVLALIEGSLSSDRADVVHALESDAPTPLPPTREGQALALDRPRSGIGQRPSRATVGVGLGYAVAYRGDEGFGHGPRASVRFPSAASFAAGASVRSALRATRALGPVDLELYGATFALGFAWTMANWPAASIELMSGPAVEWVHYTPVASSDASIGVGSAESEVRPAWDFSLRATFESPIRWALLAECPVALTRTRYDVSTSGAPLTIGRPWALSPSLGLELRF
jgi:hypothetical protein